MSELDSLRSLKGRAESLASTHLEALNLFHMDRGNGSLADLREGRMGVGGFANFFVGADEDQPSPLNRTGRESLASTARCLRSLRVCRDVKRGSADYSPVLSRLLSRYEEGQLNSYGLAHLNPFTLGQVLPVLRELSEEGDPEPLKALVEEGCARLRSEATRPGFSMTLTGAQEGEDGEEGDHGDHGRFPPNGYLTYWGLLALRAWAQFDGEAARPSLNWSETELYRQIALFVAHNDERSDAYQLGYNLLVQHRFNRIGLGDSLIDLGLRTLFRAQLERGVWEKRNPLFRFGDGGEAYCFSFEFLSTLLRQFRDEWEFLVPYESHLATALSWAERNAIAGYGPPVWRSGLVIEKGEPESWATAEVYAFLQLYASYLTWRIETAVLSDFSGRPGQTPDPEAFEGLYQPEVKLPGEDPILLTDLLCERLLEGLRAPGHRPVYSLVHHPDRRNRPRSGILFGPPGTGKTTYVKRIAQYLGWPLVILDPSDFASEGLPLIATVAGDVFSELLELEDAVIFFDEMESLMHRRDGNGQTGGGSFEQQFLTTTFIPKLQELADQAACLFFVATNHYDSIDPAAKRPGRFDFRLQVLPPAYREKLRMARKALGDDYDRVERELTRQSNRRNIALATRSEMSRLLRDIKRDPESSEELVSAFQAELAGDERLDEEAQYNSFERRP